MIAEDNFVSLDLQAPHLPTAARRNAVSATVGPCTSLYSAGLRCGDALALLCTGWLATRPWFDPPGLMHREALLLVGVLLTTTALALGYLGAYRIDRLFDVFSRLRLVLAASALATVLSCAGVTLLHDGSPSVLYWVVAWTVVNGLVLAGIPTILAYVGRGLPGIGWRVAVVGPQRMARETVRQITASPTGLAAVSSVSCHVMEATDSDGTRRLAMGEILASCRAGRVDTVVLAVPAADADLLASIKASTRYLAVNLFTVADLSAHVADARHTLQIGHAALVKVSSRPLNDWQLLQKAMLDRTLSVLALIGLLPVMGLIALAIRLDSPGPILFRQPRIGFNNQMFTVLKFRTMYHAMADLTAERQTVRNDPRVTRVGWWLRKFSLDELPQVINVLQGDMSLVGPRPHAVNTKAGTDLFHEVVKDYDLRHRVKPGITGWAQVSGWRGLTQTRHQIEQRIAHDLHYIENWSLWFDIRILALTILRELNSRVAF